MGVLQRARDTSENPRWAAKFYVRPVVLVLGASENGPPVCYIVSKTSIPARTSQIFPVFALTRALHMQNDTDGIVMLPKTARQLEAFAVSVSRTLIVPDDGSSVVMKKPEARIPRIHAIAG